MAASGDALDALSVAAESTIVSVGDTIATMLTNPEDLIFPVQSVDARLAAQNAELKRMQSKAALEKARDDYKKAKMEEKRKKKAEEEESNKNIPSYSPKKSRSFPSFRQQQQQQQQKQPLQHRIQQQPQTPQARAHVGVKKTDRVPVTPEKKKTFKPRLKIFNRGAKNKETPLHLHDQLVITPM